MKKGYVWAVLLMVSAAGVRADNVWDGSAGNGLWSDPANWSLNAVPAVGQGNIIFNNQNYGSLITLDASVTAVVNGQVYGPEWGMDWLIDGGSFTQQFVDFDHGFVFAPIGGDEAGRTVITVQNGGYLQVHNLLLGDNWWFIRPYVTLNVYDTSTVKATDWCRLGGYMNLYGGTVDITGGIEMALFAHDTGLPYIGLGLTKLDIYEGTLIIRGQDRSADIPNWISAGYLKAYGMTPNERGSALIIVDSTTIPGGTILTALPSLAARDPNPTPVNPTGSIGTLISDTEVELTLNWNAGIDPNLVRALPLNPEIVSHYVWVGTDPQALSVVASVAQTSSTDPANSQTLVLNQGTEYYWSIEEGIDDGTGNAYPAGDPNNIIGAIWSFRTKAVVPEILDPQPASAIASPDATFTAVGSDVVTGYQWYKEAGETDIELSDGGAYSGTQTATLQITGATVAEEGQYYCVGKNGLLVSEPSAPARLWTRRLMGHWKFDGDLLDSVSATVAGAPAHNGALGANTTAGPGDPNFVPGGKAGGAIEFFNDGDYIAVENADFFNFYPLGFTVSCWYRSTGEAGWRLPVSKLDAGSAGWLLGTDVMAANQATCIIEVPNTRVDGGESPDVGDGLWHLLTATYDPTDDTLRLFTDGDLDAQAVIDLSAAPMAAAPLSIGGRESESSVLAEMDDVRIYSYALNSLEVAQSYLEFSPGEWVCVEDPANPLSFDLNNDCQVDILDLASLASQWLLCQRVPAEACSF